MPRSNRHNDGRAFQEDIVTTLAAYEFKNEMRVRKVDPPVKVMGGGSARRVIFLANPFLDFAGVWTTHYGRGIFFEAKSTSEERLRFDSDSGITTAQLNALRSWRNSGALSFVLWQCRGRGVKLVPTQELCEARDLKREGEGFKYIAWQNVRHVVKQGTGTRLVDFQPVLERIYAQA